VQPRPKHTSGRLVESIVGRTSDGTEFFANISHLTRPVGWIISIRSIDANELYCTSICPSIQDALYQVADWLAGRVDPLK